MSAFEPAFSVTIEPEHAQMVAKRIRQYEEKTISDLNRVEFASRSPLVNTVDDYLIVSVLADDVLELTTLELADLFDHESRWSLVSTIATAYLETVATREIFGKYRVDTSAARFEFPTSDNMTVPSALEEGDAFEPTSMDWETVTVSPHRYRVGSVIGSTLEPRPTFIESIDELCGLLYREIDEALPDATQMDEDETIDDLYDAYIELEAANYRPDTIIVPQKTSMPRGESIHETVKNHFGHECEIHTSIWQPLSEVIFASSDHVGYETHFSDLEGEIDDAVLTQTSDDPFEPIQIRLFQKLNWVVTQEDAVARLRL